MQHVCEVFEQIERNHTLGAIVFLGTPGWVLQRATDDVIIICCVLLTVAADAMFSLVATRIQNQQKAHHDHRANQKVNQAKPIAHHWKPQLAEHQTLPSKADSNNFKGHIPPKQEVQVFPVLFILKT